MQQAKGSAEKHKLAIAQDKQQLTDLQAAQVLLEGKLGDLEDRLRERELEGNRLRLLVKESTCLGGKGRSSQRVLEDSLASKQKKRDVADQACVLQQEAVARASRLLSALLLRKKSGGRGGSGSG